MGGAASDTEAQVTTSRTEQEAASLLLFMLEETKEAAEIIGSPALVRQQ